MKSPFLAVFLLFTMIRSSGQDLQVVSSLPSQLTECSGMATAEPSGYWTLNDGGNPAELYLIDTSGIVLRTLTVANMSNRDWESLATDDSGTVYIGDFGNNDHNRRDLRIGRISRDALAGDTTVATIHAFTYEDQSEFPPARTDHRFDCEAMFILGDSIYLITKNWTLPFTGMAYLYALPLDWNDPVARLRDSAYLGDNPFLSQVTGCDVKTDMLVLLGYGGLWTCGIGNGKIAFSQLQFRSFAGVRQFEALAFESENTLLIAEEELSGAANLYRADLSRLTSKIEDVSAGVFIERVNTELILSSPDKKFLHVSLFDMEGRLLLVLDQRDHPMNYISIPMKAKGIMIIDVKLDQGRFRKKISWP